MQKRDRVGGAKSQRQPFGAFEALESRVFLAANTFDISNIPTLSPMTGGLTDIKNGMFANAGPSLLSLYTDYRSHVRSGGTAGEYDSAVASSLYVQQGSVLVTIRGRTGAINLANTVRSNGGTILTNNGKYGVIDAFIPIGKLRGLAANPVIASVNPVLQGLGWQQGVSDNTADQTLLADRLRSTFNLTGAGVKIGVMSDSVNLLGTGLSGSVASGDLPSDVEIIEDSSAALGGGTDEGRAMMELIHDIAPGAKFAFATANGGQQHFADNIRALRAAGCDIIVDDRSYLAEPFFQPGVIDQAIAEFVNGGGIYLTAAGNLSTNAYEAPTNFTTGGKHRYVDFDEGPGIDTRMRIQVTGNGNLTLQWDNPYNGLVGSATSDLDIFFYDVTQTGSPLVARGSSNNLRTGVPIETVGLSAGAYDVEIRVSGTLSGAVLPTRFKFVAVGGLSNIEFSTGLRGALFGHQAFTGVISVGAVNAANAPPFVDEGNPISNENFSSFGPATQIFDLNGNRLPAPVALLKPDVSGIDGTNTSFFTGNTGITNPTNLPDTSDPDVLPNFFGTSAAAPNVAAVVALMLQANPQADQAEILNALKSTARPLNGADPATYDPAGGFGLVNAYAAIQQMATAPVPNIVNPAPNGTFETINRIKVYFSQQISGFDISDLTLTRDDGPNILTGNNAPYTIDGGRVWWIRSLSNVLAVPGHYILTVQSTDTDIVNILGQPLDGSATVEFDVFATPAVPAAPSILRQDTSAFTSSLIRLRWNDNATSENRFVVQRAENSNFTSGLRSFIAPENATSFDDTQLPSTGRVFFYRVYAINGLGDTSAFSNVIKVTSLSPGEIILDNTTPNRTLYVGFWDTSSVVPGSLGSDYREDGNSGKGSKTARYTPNITAAGTYRIYMRWTKAADRATNVPVDINLSNGTKVTVVVDQRNTGGNGWVQLGTFDLSAGTGQSVLIRTTGTDGKVIADGVWFQPIGTSA